MTGLKVLSPDQRKAKQKNYLPQPGNSLILLFKYSANTRKKVPQQ